MKKSVMAAAVAVTAAHGVEAAPQTKYLHVVRTGSVHVEAPPHLAFVLFTGPGEELWIEEWEPTVLSGDGLEAGTVFTTEIGEKIYWIVVDFDREARRARYARVSPDSRAGTVEVRVESDGGDGSIAHVTYELTALNEDGNEILEGFDEASCAEMMTTWEQMIRDENIDYESELFVGRQ